MTADGMDREGGGTDGMARALAWIVLAPWIVFLGLRLAGVGTSDWMVAAIGATPYVAAATLIPRPPFAKTMLVRRAFR